MDINTQILAIDEYSILDLMGLGEMSAEQQQNLILDINSLVWTKFLNERLAFIFTSEQIQEIKDKMDSGEKTEQILQHMNQTSPNFSELLAEYTRYFKIEYIRKHYETTIVDLEKLISETQNDETKKTLEDSLRKNIRASECINSFQWDEVLRIFYPEDFQN